MAKNLELREKIGGSFDDADSLIYVRTHIDQVDELLDTNNKIKLGIIPSALLESRKMAGVITQDMNFNEALGLIAMYHENATSLYPGSFF